MRLCESLSGDLLRCRLGGAASTLRGVRRTVRRPARGVVRPFASAQICITVPSSCGDTAAMLDPGGILLGLPPRLWNATSSMNRVPRLSELRPEPELTSEESNGFFGGGGHAMAAPRRGVRADCGSSCSSTLGGGSSGGTGTIRPLVNSALTCDTGGGGGKATCRNRRACSRTASVMSFCASQRPRHHRCNR